MSELFENIVSGRQGVTIVNDTTELTANIAAIYVLEDTVFASIKIGGVDVKSSYISTAATAVKAGALIVPLAGAVFSGVDLTSGSVAAIRKSS
jgi:hypothetical protein